MLNAQYKGFLQQIIVEGWWKGKRIQASDLVTIGAMSDETITPIIDAWRVAKITQAQAIQTKATADIDKYTVAEVP